MAADRSLFRKLVLGLVAFRVAVLGVCAFLPLSLPGIWRQTDTMGVAMRYWMRWTVEHHAVMPLLPAVLNSGDAPGINAMEFPLLNLLFAPAFALGPYWGKVLCMLGILALVHGLLYLCYLAWRPHRESLGVDSFAFALVAIATFSSGWTGKFIPDLVSVLLCLLGVGLSWSRTRPLASGALCAAGILMKPTSVVVLMLYLAHPDFLKRIRANLPWGTAAVGAALLYYTLGIHRILRYEQGIGLFAVAPKPFLADLIAFFSDYRNWTNMWVYRPFFSLGAYLVIPLSLFALAARMPGYRRFAALWLTLLLQYVTIAAMGGSHTFVHDYYFLGLAPTSALILWWLITRCWPMLATPPILAVMFAGLLVPTAELSTMDLRPLYKPGYRASLGVSAECQAMKEDHPEIPWDRATVFRSSDEPFPALGLCFGERERGTKARYGFFWNSSGVPAECRPIDRMELITLADCGSPGPVQPARAGSAHL